MTLLEKPMWLKPPGKAVGPEIHTGVTSAPSSESAGKSALTFSALSCSMESSSRWYSWKGNTPILNIQDSSIIMKFFLQEYHGKIIDRWRTSIDIWDIWVSHKSGGWIVQKLGNLGPKKWRKTSRRMVIKFERKTEILESTEKNQRFYGELIVGYHRHLSWSTNSWQFLGFQWLSLGSFRMFSAYTWINLFWVPYRTIATIVTKVPDPNLEVKIHENPIDPIGPVVHG